MTVLIVDDFVDALEVWTIFLNAAGFTVATAANGLAGLHQARTLRPDAIVLDLQMPGLSGPDLARALRADEATRHIPLIAATGHTRGHEAEAREAGVDSIVQKPCDPDALVAEIRRLVNARIAASASPDRV